MKSSKVKTVPKFVQIASAPFEVEFKSGRTILGTMIYGLDKAGRVWRRYPQVVNKGWELVENNVEDKP